MKRYKNEYKQLSLIGYGGFGKVYTVQNILDKNLPGRVLDDIQEDIAYQITASLNHNKKRNGDELYPLYLKQGGKDSNDDFKLKWESGDINIGNIRELREFKSKLNKLKPTNI